MNIEKLLYLENKYSLWKLSFKGYPIMPQLRAQYDKSTLEFSNHYPVSIRIIYISLKTFFHLLFFARRYDEIYTLLNRENLINFYKINSTNKKSFLLTRPEKNTKNSDYNSFIFDIIRLLLQKYAYFFFFLEYSSLKKKLSIALELPLCAKGIKIAIGDYCYFRILRTIIPSRIPIFFSCAIVPQIAMYRENNIIEVQHGVILGSEAKYFHNTHVKNRFICYHSHYKEKLTQTNFGASIEVCSFLKTKKEKAIKYNFVLYTQPIKEFQDYICKNSDYINRHPELFIAKHPKDNHFYPINQKKIICPKKSEVKTPISLSSTIIEDFALNNEKVLQLNLKLKQNYIKEFQYLGELVHQIEDIREIENFCYD